MTPVGAALTFRPPAWTALLSLAAKALLAAALWGTLLACLSGAPPVKLLSQRAHEALA